MTFVSVLYGEIQHVNGSKGVGLGIEHDVGLGAGVAAHV
jgi:hypothetical protein